MQYENGILCKGLIYSNPLRGIQFFNYISYGLFSFFNYYRLSKNSIWRLFVYYTGGNENYREGIIIVVYSNTRLSLTEHSSPQLEKPIPGYFQNIFTTNTMAALGIFKITSTIVEPFGNLLYLTTLINFQIFYFTKLMISFSYSWVRLFGFV